MRSIVVGLAMLCVAPACARSPAPAASGSPGSTGSAPSDPVSGSAEPGAGSAEAEADVAGTMFKAMEERLERAPWQVRFELSAEGAVVASLAGSLSMAEEVELRATGSFGGAAQDLRLWTEGDRLRGGPREAPTLDVPRPAELEPALVIGMARMGLMHDVAMLVGGQPPDHASGGVREWLQTIEHERVDANGETGIRFVLVVAGERAARGTLWLDARGLPVRRELTVEFPDGEMRVVERYEWLEPLPPAG